MSLSELQVRPAFTRASATSVVNGPTHSSLRQMSGVVVSVQIESKQMSETQTDEYIVGVVFAQHFNLKNGLELFGYAADIAVRKELSQIHGLSTYETLASS